MFIFDRLLELCISQSHSAKRQVVNKITRCEVKELKEKQHNNIFCCNDVVNITEFNDDVTGR